MTDPNKTVFISYRRSVSRDRAVLIFNHLRQHGYDVFLDVRTIDSGAFDSVILNQIGARTHFIILIHNGSLERCQNEGDWLRREIQEALRLGRNIIPIMDEGLDFDREMNFLPSAWRDAFKRINSLPWSHYYFEYVLKDLMERFLKPSAFPVTITPVPVNEQQKVQNLIAQVPQQSAPPPPKIFTPPIPSFLPQPFDWCKITGGKVTLVPDSTVKEKSYLKNNRTLNVPDFFMAKYPVTNAQYQAFVDARDGYNNPEWWAYSEGAKAWRVANPKPRDTAFVGDDHPRTNITWYESVAFTIWLSQKLSLNIHLPTDEQWQRAAIGDTGWAYPYGDTFDKNRCNFNTNGTTPVTQYPNGASPFGVMDMTGNVWEWCLTSYDKGNIALKDAVDDRTYVLRGGSWRTTLPISCVPMFVSGTSLVSGTSSGVFVLPALTNPAY